MRSISNTLLKSRTYNRQVAIYSCALIEYLRADFTPANFQLVQERVRIGLQEVEAELRLLNARQGRRSELIKRRCARNPNLHRIRNQHDHILKAHEVFLRERREILRQTGDACAWMMLRGDPHLILPLFSPASTQYLSEGLGLYGPWCVRKEAHASGRFFVVETDLTRCLGTGDLVVVPSNGRWIRPLVFEAKTHGQFEKEGEVEIDLSAWLVGHPLDRKVCEDFCLTLGFDQGGNRKLSARVERQYARMEERGELLLRITERLRDPLKPAVGLWSFAAAVIEKAMRTGVAFDIAEPGVVYTAVRNRVTDRAEQSMDWLLRELRERGLTKSAFRTTTSADFSSSAYLGALVPPMHLWKVPLAHRVELLCGEIFFACVIDSSVWERNFRENGLNWREDDGAWVFDAPGKDLIMGQIEVRKLQAGVAFGAFSPRALARAIAGEIAV